MVFLREVLPGAVEGEEIIDEGDSGDAEQDVSRNPQNGRTSNSRQFRVKRWTFLQPNAGDRASRDKYEKHYRGLVWNRTAHGVTFNYKNSRKGYERRTKCHEACPGESMTA
jgi:hypothetical protein